MKTTNYDLKPKIKIKEQIKISKIDALITLINSRKYHTIVIETYPGVRLNEVKRQLLDHITDYYQVHWSEDFALQGQAFREAIMEELTNDRVFGVWTKHQYRDYFTSNIPDQKVPQIVFGTGANYLVKKPDLIIYFDVPRWEIQKRYRNNEPVFFGGTLEDETIKNFKRGYFVEWRMADTIKQTLMPQADYYVDSSTNDFKVMTTADFFDVINNVAQRPFRLVPYFDYGVWGGKWMEHHLQLGTNQYSRWAWGFDGVPEENSILLQFNDEQVEMPAQNIVLFAAQKLLGQRVWARFGYDFPIRFDFLDTIKGQNLSLQVHPDFHYIREQFRAPYSQNESYYILDVDPTAKPTCYLGVKKNIDRVAFIEDLKMAQQTNKMDVEKYINRWPVKKHDHLSHPSGVIHSSASGCMVLEISATPYIFTFKLWDWGRLGLNGKPRPINIEHGAKVIDYSFDTERTKRELINKITTIDQTSDFIEEKTGLHPNQFLETRRLTIKSAQGAIFNTRHSVNMLNLVAGSTIIVESPTQAFLPLEVNYAETFIIPENCQSFRIRSKNYNPQEQVMILQAFVRTSA